MSFSVVACSLDPSIIQDKGRSLTRNPSEAGSLSTAQRLETNRQPEVYPAVPVSSLNLLPGPVPASVTGIETKNLPNILFVPDKTRAVEKAQTVHYVQLAAYHTTKRAEIGWQQLVLKAPELLGELDHVIVAPDPKFNAGALLRLRSEAFGRRADARNLCNALKRRNLACIIVESRVPPGGPNPGTHANLALSAADALTGAEHVYPGPIRHFSQLNTGYGAMGPAEAVGPPPPSPASSSPAALESVTPSTRVMLSDDFPPHDSPAMAAIGDAATTPAADRATAPLSPFLAETVKIASTVNGDGARIVLTWQKPVGYSVEENGSDLLIRFDRALGDAPVAGITSDLKTWVNGVSTGYDTLLLQARRGVRFAVAMEGAQLYIDLASTRDDKPVAKSGADSDTDQENPTGLELALLKAQLMLAVGRQEAAARLLEEEARRHPNNPSVLAALADLENQAGRWHKALALYDRALFLHPRDEDILFARRSIVRDRAPYLNSEAEHVRIGDDQTQNSLRLSGQYQYSVAKRLRLGFSYEVRRTEAEDVRRVDGRILDFDGTRQRGELSATRDLMDGRRLRVALLVGQETVGVGAAYALPDFRGETQFAVEFNRPSWDFIEGFLEQGVRHQIGALREHRFTPRLSGQAAAFARIYGIDGDSNVASSLALEGGLQYLVLPGSPSLTVGYRFDAEYRDSVETRLDQASAPFEPIPLVSREIHGLEASATYDLTQNWRARAYTGYGVDRFADGALFGGIGLAHQGDGPLKGRLFAERGLSTTDTSDPATRYGFSLTLRF